MLIVESEVFKKEYQLPTRSPRALDAARKLCELGFLKSHTHSVYVLLNQLIVLQALVIPRHQV